MTMSSREIAELVEKRHDHVKRTIDTMLEKKGIIEFPQIEEISTATKPVTIYRLEKRDTYVVVARLYQSSQRVLWIAGRNWRASRRKASWLSCQRIMRKRLSIFS